MCILYADENVALKTNTKIYLLAICQLELILKNMQIVLDFQR